MFKIHSVYQTFYFQRTCICPSVWHRHAEYFETHLHVWNQVRSISEPNFES